MNRGVAHDCEDCKAVYTGSIPVVASDFACK